MSALRSLAPTASRSLAAYPIRSFASSSRLRLPEADPAPTTSEPATPTERPTREATFGSLRTALTGNSPAASGAHNIASAASGSQPSAHTPERAAASVRGYELDALPPNVDPMLELFTNLLMKHGKKGEAQRRVSNILGMM